MPASSHLAIFNYDQQSEEEILRKVDILVATAAPDIQAILDYEEAHEKRPKIVKHLKALLEDPDEAVDEKVVESLGGGDETGEGSADSPSQKTGTSGRSAASK